jgi:hypothetical protein
MATNQDQSGGNVNGRSTTFQTHPLYKERFDDWLLMEDCYAGSRRVKDKGQVYLPYTPGQTADGVSNATDRGYLDYQAYKLRALFHDVVKEAVQSMVGVMHRKEALITLPDRLKDMLDDATPDGESLNSLLRKINEQQLLNARVGLLVEVPDGQTVDKTLPFIATYAARSVINWDTGVSDQGEREIEMVSLDESAWERRQVFNWVFEQKTRVLLSDTGQINAGLTPAAKGYVATVLRDGRILPVEGDFTTPSIGGRTMDRVPFVFVNANDLVPDPEAPPLLGLANIALALYRADADYRHNLFMSGQDTLVLIGSTDDNASKRTGAGAIIDVPKGGDAKYVGVSAAGLEAQAKAIAELRTLADDRGSKLLDFSNGTGKAASGEALKVRIAARTTTLTSIARTGAEGLEECLRMCAEWVGCSQSDVDMVQVEPNLEFSETALDGPALLAFVQAKTAGLPLSWETIHDLMRSNDLTDLTYEDEVAKIDEEPPMLGAGSVPIMGPDGQPMLHPTTGKPLTEPAPKRGVTGTGQNPKPPATASETGAGGSSKGQKGSKKVAQANNSGQGNQ